MLTPCTISVTIREETERIRIQVSDNGPGMTAEELHAVRSFAAEAKGSGIGLKNIYERLKMAFDRDAEFEVCSAAGEGTTVTIRIPKIEAGKTNV